MVSISRQQIKDAKSSNFTSRQNIDSSSRAVNNYSSEVASNFLPSAFNYLKLTTQAVVNPISTAKTTYDIGKSVLSLVPGIEGDETLARGIGQMYKDKYGGGAKIAESFKNDPVGTLADLGIFLQGAGGVARLSTKPGSKSRGYAESVGKLGKNIEPSTAKIRGKEIGIVAGAKSLGRAADFVGTDVITPIQAATTGTKQQALEIARKKGVKNKDFALGRSGKVTESQYVNAVKKSRDSFLRNATKKLTDATSAVNLGRIAVPQRSVNEIKSIVPNIKNQRIRERGDTDLSKIFFKKELLQLNRLEKRIDDFVSKQNPSASNLDNLLKNFDDDFQFVKGVDPINSRPKRIHAIINKQVTDILYNLDGLPPSYRKAMDDYSKARTRLKSIEKELSLNSTDSTIYQKLRGTLRKSDSVSEQALLDLPGGEKIFTTLAGQLTEPLFPSEYLRIAQPSGAAGILSSPFTLGGAAGGFALGGLTGAVGGGLAGLGSSTLFQSPRIVSSLQSRFGQLSRGAKNIMNDPKARAAGSLIPKLRPIEEIKQEVANPLRRRGLL